MLPDTPEALACSYSGRCTERLGCSALWQRPERSRGLPAPVGGESPVLLRKPAVPLPIDSGPRIDSLGCSGLRRHRAGRPVAWYVPAGGGSPTLRRRPSWLPAFDSERGEEHRDYSASPRRPLDWNLSDSRAPSRGEF